MTRTRTRGLLSIAIVALVALSGGHASAALDVYIKTFTAFASGDQVTFSFELCARDQSTGNFQAKLWTGGLPAAPTCATSVAATDTGVFNLAANACLSFPVTYPIATGSRTGWLLVDSACSLTETDEANNVRSAMYTVGPTAASLQAQIATLAQDVSTREKGRCPVGYAESTSAGFSVCARAADQMVKAGPLWADRFESTVVNAAYFNGGKCDNPGGVGTRYGQTGDDYPPSFPDDGKATAALYACSISGPRPSRSITWFQAAQACVAAGKRLCANDEWQLAAAGTSDPGSSAGAGGLCNTALDNTRAAGAGAACRSRVRAEDMIGNLAEWTGKWSVSGKTWIVGMHEGGSTPWGSGFSTDDVTANIDGRAYGRSTFENGLPSGWVRGGDYSGRSGSGVFAVDGRHGPVRALLNIGLRCCRTR